MSYYICCISKNFSNEPVFCKKNGLIYDINIVYEFFNNKNTCPISNLELEKEDFIKINSNNYVYDNLKFNKSKCMSVLEDIKDINEETELLKLKNKDLSLKLSNLTYGRIAFENIKKNLLDEIRVLERKFDEKINNQNLDYINIKLLNMYNIQQLENNYNKKVVLRKERKKIMINNYELWENAIVNKNNSININSEILEYFLFDNILVIILINGIFICFKNKELIYQEKILKNKIIKIIQKENKIFIWTEYNLEYIKYDKLLNQFDCKSIDIYQNIIDIDFFEDLEYFIILNNEGYIIIFNIEMLEILKIKFKKDLVEKLSLHVDQKLLILTNKFGNILLYNFWEKSIVLSIYDNLNLNDNKFLLSMNNANNIIFGNDKYLYNLSLTKEKIINKYENMQIIKSLKSDMRGFNLLINTKDNIFIIDNKFSKIINLKNKLELTENPNLIVDIINNDGYLINKGYLNFLNFN